jgi:serine/threonine protein kinase
VLRWAYALGTLAYLPVIEFLGDLARRSGAVRPLGLPLRVGQWTLRVLVVIGVPRVLWTDTIVAGTFYNPATGWETRWGWYWPGFVVVGAVFVAWGLACWNGQRRRCEQVDAELWAGLPYLVMELVEGISLGDLIDAVGPLRPESVARLGAQLAEGLSVAHAAGVIHRDLKPDNVMIVRGADLDVAKIVDFGVARLVDPAVTRLTATGSIFGTPLYMAPEQARGETAGPAADLYALGTLLYEAASGAPPFRADSPMRVLVMHMNEQPARVPLAGALGDLVMDLLAKDPSARPPSTGLADRFAVLAGGRPHIEPLGAVAATG